MRLGGGVPPIVRRVGISEQVQGQAAWPRCVHTALRCLLYVNKELMTHCLHNRDGKRREAGEGSGDYDVVRVNIMRALPSPGAETAAFLLAGERISSFLEN